MKRILIIEDVEFNRDLLVQLLEDEYELLTAPDGETGILLAEQEQPDLILMIFRYLGLTVGRRRVVSKLMSRFNGLLSLPSRRTPCAATKNALAMRLR